MAKASKQPIRIYCPSCRKRVGRDKDHSTKNWVAYPAVCPNCGTDLGKTLVAAKLASGPQEVKDAPKGKTPEQIKREAGITSLKEQLSGGRPTKLTWDLIYDVGQFLRMGAYATTVMKALNIKERTWYAWLDKAVKAEVKAMSKRTKADQLYIAFGMVIDQADAEGELALLLKVNRGGFGWQGSAWILERKHPDRWGRSRAEAPAGGSLDALVEAIGKLRAAKK